jgi:hypothetical protein
MMPPDGRNRVREKDVSEFTGTIEDKGLTKDAEVGAATGPPNLDLLVGDVTDALPPADRNAFGVEAAWRRPRGVIDEGDGRVVIGRVGAPPRQEATSSAFHFWIPEEAVVEATQIVTTESVVGGKIITFYGLIEEVHRWSRRRDMGHESDEFDGDLSATPDFETEGITYADVAILRAEPLLLTPPRERSPVRIATGDDGMKAYGMDRMQNPLTIGVIKNGGSATAGPGRIDLDYLLGENGGHLNVNGKAGMGTKSSFLLTMVYLLMAEARRQESARPSDPERLHIVPVIFNVKNYDLFHIDRPGSRYNPGEHLADWKAVGIDNPGPFEGVSYFAAQEPGSDVAVQDTGRAEGVRPYSWSLQDVITQGLFSYLFTEDDAQNDNFAALLLDLENLFTRERLNNDGSVLREIQPTLPGGGGDTPRTFDALVDWLRSEPGTEFLTTRRHSAATVSKLVRRLMRLIYECRGVLRRTDLRGKPLDVTRTRTSNPIVIDLNALSGVQAMQKFVVAAVLQQLIRARTGANAIRGLRYLIVLDELNRFAPANSRDPITRLFETVASEMRSQGILLFGAQQQASKVSGKVIENAATTAVGQTGGLELSQTAWSSLSPASKRKAEMLDPGEKLILQSGFRQPLHLKIPYPAWAMNPREVTTTGTTSPDDAEDDDLPIGN